MIIATCTLDPDQSHHLTYNIHNWLRANNRSSTIVHFPNLNDLSLYSAYYGEPDIIFYHIVDQNELLVSRLLMLRKICPTSEIVLMSINATNAVEGYRIGATWFLEMPIIPANIQAALELCIHRFLLKQKNKFCLNSQGEEIAVSYEDILFFESIKHYIFMQTTNRSHRFRENISMLNSVLPSTQFMRCHKCYIINLIHIQKIEGNTIHLTGKKEIPLSRNYRESIIRMFALFQKTNRSTSYYPIMIPCENQSFES